MRRILFSILGATLIAGSPLVYAELDDAMRDLNQSYNMAMQTEDLLAFKEALQKMKAAVAKSQKEIPPKLEKESVDSAKIQDYQHGLEILLSQIDKAEQLADAGQLEQAKAEAKRFEQTRNTYHQKYK